MDGSSVEKLPSVLLAGNYGETIIITLDKRSQIGQKEDRLQRRNPHPVFSYLQRLILMRKPAMTRTGGEIVVRSKV